MNTKVVITALMAAEPQSQEAQARTWRVFGRCAAEGTAAAAGLFDHGCMVTLWA